MGSNSILAFVLEWGVLIISIFLVFSPFIYLGIRKWKKHLPVNWWQVIGAYLSSFAIYIMWDWWILVKVDDWLLHSVYADANWWRRVLYNPGFKMIFITLIAWPALVFYSCKLMIKEKFTLLNFVLSLIISISLICGLIALYAFVMVVILGQIGSKYF